MKKIKIWGLFCVALGLCGCSAERPEVVWQSACSTEQTASETAQIPAREAGPAEPARIMVDISGAVANPGVYELREGARVCDAVEAAGGLTGEADLDALNQAQLLSDAQKIRVCTREETAQGLPNGAADGADDRKININRADAAQLATLSGIGESRARDIIAYREANGAFQSIEDIMKVSGIKEATFNKIKDAIAVG